jgi:hypothetical protein
MIPSRRGKEVLFLEHRQIRVVTNNQLIKEYTEILGIPSDYWFGESHIALRKARDMLMEGWRLAVDPLSGYNTRFSPYHRKSPKKLYAGQHRALIFSTSRISRCCLDNSG